MIVRELKEKDLVNYIDDICSCYNTNKLILDSQNPLHLETKEEVYNFLKGYLLADDSCIQAIFDNNEDFLYGIVIYDNIRFANKSIAQIHIVNDKSIFGKKVRDLYNNLIENCIFDTLYAEIPSIAVHAIGMCKRLGFKKTGYIPNALPYVNSKGIEQMYDIQIWTYQRGIK